MSTATTTEEPGASPQAVRSALEQFGDDLAVFDSAARDAAREAKANGATAPAARLERVTDHLARSFEYLRMRVLDYLEADGSEPVKGETPRDPGEIQAVRATVAEWLEHHAPRIVSGEYMEDLPD